MLGDEIGVGAEAVAGALDLDDDDMMEQAAEQCRGEDGIAEDLAHSVDPSRAPIGATRRAAAGSAGMPMSTVLQSMHTLCIQVGAPMSEFSRSNYNFFSANKQGFFIYNSRTGAIVNTDELNYNTIRQVEASLSRISNKDRDVFLDAGILICEEDEISMIERIMERRNESLRFSHLVIMPTLACNFSCDYCFQNSFRTKHRITTDTLDEIVSYIGEQFNGSSKTFDITWFGGEPLVAFREIEYFYSRLRELSLLNAIEGQAMISNASLLDQEKALFLHKHGVSKIQVSFDALHYVHGKKRGVITSDGAPSKIVENCQAARAGGISIEARINLDAASVEHRDEIVRLLKAFGLGDDLYLARIDDHVAEEKSYSLGCEVPELLSRQAFARMDLSNHLKPEKIQHLFRQLTPRSHYCGATDGTMLVIGPDGSISRCWNSAGIKSEEFGRISSLSHSDSRKIGPVWDSYRATNYDECRRCKVLPLCTGGCSQPRVLQDITHPPCTPIKFNIQDILDYVLEKSKMPSGSQ